MKTYRIMKNPLVCMLGLLLAAPSVRAISSYVSQIPNGATFSCANCHVNPAGGGTRTPFGNAFLSNSHVWNAALAVLDSDGDNYSNGVELGDPSGAWRAGQANPPGPVYNPGDATSHPGAIATAPAITTQPASQTVNAGATVIFTVSATGTAPLNYQWKKSGVNISGATTATLTLSSVTTASAGNYAVTVTNSAGSITSSTATLTVNVVTAAPTITTQPASQTVTAGATVTFTVNATGTAPLSYQWMKGGASISGATTATLTLSSVTTASAGSYTVLVSNSIGTVTSAAAILTVNSAGAPTIASQPASQIVIVGTSVTFTVSATGTAPLNYQWMKGGANISGATTATLTLSSVTATDAGNYTVLVSNSAGSVTSAAATLTVNPVVIASAGTAILGWNNLGMHCMDSDYSVFSILPPYNTIESQLIVNGALVRSGSGYSVTYEAIADPDGSFNSTSIGKGNFYTFTSVLYGAVAPDMGLAGWGMPGLNNTPQNMLFEVNNSPAAGVSTPVNWWRAEGIPMSPFDNSMQRNEYPLMRLTARNSANAVIATSDIVLPVSDEMDCRACHASGSQAAAQPLEGWVFSANPEQDYRLNILRLHDEIEFLAHGTTYTAALATKGFNPAGLYANVVTSGRPIACNACHLSEALQGSGLAGIPPLTTSVHSLHAGVVDPVLNVTLDNSVNRAACYRCHPGSTTKCLRGAMGSAVAADGTMEMQCQSCHGSMSAVGSANRVGWFMEPACQSCHTGTATSNNGQIRYTSVFTDNNGTVRQAVNQTFATTPNTPATGLSLYRFSVGHGGLQCSACHGSTHAEFPSAFRNDNIESQELQGHSGMISECTTCHATVPSTTTGGPHGLHPIGPAWVSRHQDVAENGGAAQCQACHGTDYRGTVLSLMQAPRTLNGQVLFRGAIVGCYLCHNGPGGDGTPPAAPTVSDVSVSTAVGQSVSMTLPVTGANATVRIISQAANGSVGLIGNIATYFPDPSFVGTDSFTFAAYNGSRNSTLATGTITVGGGGGPVAPVITTQPVSQTVNSGATVTFTVAVTGTGPLSYQWQKNNANISGATGTSLTLANVTAADAAGYAVVVANVAGSVKSATATLTVNTVVVGPTITTQPVSQTVNVGANVTFSVVATGTAPLRYQWRKDSVNISGATSSSLNLVSVTTAAAGGYSVVVSNAGGSVTSSTAALTVNTASITVALTSPINGAIYGTGASVQLTASVSPISSIAQVRFYDGSTLLGSDTSAPFSITRTFAAGVHTLTARATSFSGTTVTSAPVQITIRRRDGNLASRGLTSVSGD